MERQGASVRPKVSDRPMTSNRRAKAGSGPVDCSSKVDRQGLACSDKISV
jgi:hypothetical protein